VFRPSLALPLRADIENPRKNLAKQRCDRFRIAKMDAANLSDGQKIMRTDGEEKITAD
jgi:hypothetical protein